MLKLYRGVTKEFDSLNNGKICPKGNQNKIVMKVGDDKFKIDGKFNIGKSENNVARAHQIKSGMHKGSGISTSRSFEVAKRFATNNNTTDGYIYSIDENSLLKYDIGMYEYPDPLYENEKEVTLITKCGKCLPSEVIINKVEVLPD